MTQYIARTYDGSQERWPNARSVPEHAPNLLLILLDDVGFAQLGCFGGSIRTPNIDRIAAEGLRFTNFHTAGVCSPTRASLLTGRHPHAVGFGNVTERMAGYPGYTMQLPDDAATVATVLRDAGYSTRAVGKWHLTPSYECGPQGPYDRWPLGRGFQRFYGFLGGVADQYCPELVRDNSLLATPDRPDYHLSEDLVDESIAQLGELIALAPGRPFLHYLSFGAAHAPHQVVPEWIEHYAGAFDHGWDEERERILERQIQLGLFPEGTRLGPSNPGVAPWAGLEPAERAAYARMMEVYAGFLEHADAQIGRLLDQLEATGRLDDTVVMLVSDNGASGEGGPCGLIDTAFDGVDLADSPEVREQVGRLGGRDLNNHYPWGWAQAGNTPFRWYKQFTYGGGITNGLIVRWPGGGVPAGELRRQYHHVVDITPTLLDLAGVTPPTEVNGVSQQPMHGVSMTYAFADADAEPRRRSQHYELWGNRGFYRDGLMAISRLHPTAERARPPLPPTPRLADATWELYDHRRDPSETTDLSADRPEELQELVDLWWAAAGTYQVLPVDDRPRGQRWPTTVPLPAGHDPERTVFHGPGGPYERGGAPRIAGVAFRLLAEVTVVPGDHGTLFTMGSHHGGYAWSLTGGQLVFEVGVSPIRSDRVGTALDLTPGRHRLGVSVGPSQDGSVPVALSVDDVEVCQGRVPALIGRFPVHAGRASVGFAVHRTAGGLLPPDRFTGTLHTLTVLPCAGPRPTAVETPATLALAELPEH